MKPDTAALVKLLVATTSKILLKNISVIHPHKNNQRKGVMMTMQEPSVCYWKMTDMYKL